MGSPELWERAGENDVDVLIQGYSSYLHALGKSPKTVKQYTKSVKRWAAWWRRPVEFFQLEEWDDYVAYLHKIGVSGRSIRCYQSALRRFFKYLRRRKICTNNPAEDAETIAVVKALPEFLLEHEITALLSKAESPKYAAAFELLYSCGLRNEECRSLCLHQIRGDHLQIFGKGRKERIIPLPEGSKAILERWLKERRSDSRYVFPNSLGSAMDERTFDRAFQRAVVASGVKRVTPHALRHSIATHLVMRGVPIEQVQVFLGHEQIETTMIYVHLVKQLTQSAIIAAHPRTPNTCKT